MKRFFAFLAAAAMLVNLSACDKDDDGGGEEGNNFIKIGAQTYELQGSFCVMGSGDGFNMYEIAFFEKAMDISNMENAKAPEGIAVAIGLIGDAFTDESALSIPDGSYIFTKETDTAQAMLQIVEAFYMDIPEGFDLVEDEILSIDFGVGDDSNRLTFNVKHVSGDIYEFEWTGGIDEAGNAVSGYYKGAVTFLNIEDILVEVDEELEL